MLGRIPAALVSLGLVASAAWPGARRDLHGADSFPLSTYPMFATPRPTTIALDYAVAVRNDGTRTAISPRLVGSAEVLQARATIARALAGGKAASEDLCRRIASRIATAGGTHGVASVAIVSGRHDAIALLQESRRGSEMERVRCPVVGKEAP